VQFLAVEQILRGGKMDLGKIQGISKKLTAPKSGGGGGSGGGILLGLAQAAPKVLKYLIGGKAIDSYIKNADKVHDTAEDVKKSRRKRKDKEFLAKLLKKKKRK